MGELSTGYKKCNLCNEVKPINNFHKNKSTTDGLQGRCTECLTIVLKIMKRGGINLPEEYINEHNKDDIEGAKILLTRMGFDIEVDIYQQFRQRIIEKHNVDIDNIPRKNKSGYVGDTRTIEYQRWYNQNLRKR